MNDCFVYISQVPRTGKGGQNKFEKCFIDTLLKKKCSKQKFDIKIFSVSLEGEKSTDERLTLIPLWKKSYTGFILHQFQLFFYLGIFFWRRRKSNLSIFVRYHPAMLAPLFFSYLFGIRLSMRTGPVLPSLFYYNKNPRWIVFHGIKMVLGLFYRRALAIVTVSGKNKEWVMETYKIDPEKIMVIPNVADTSLFFSTIPDRAKWNLPENDFIFGFAGTIDEPQGLDTVLHAMGLLKKNNQKVPLLFMVGDGNYRLTLQALSEKLNIADSIIWTGYIPHEEVPAAINACNMLLAPYQKKLLEFKGSGHLKLWEYLACDKPILVSKHKDHQFLEDLNLGKMIEPDNVEHWAEALKRESQKKDISLHGRGEKFVVEGHSYQLLVEKFIAISFGRKLDNVKISNQADK